MDAGEKRETKNTNADHNEARLDFFFFFSNGYKMLVVG